MGAGGRDFHNFNAVYRNDSETEIVAITATQIPYISGRTYPPSLAGPNYPEGIPIIEEEDLPELLDKEQIDEVVFAYSDVSNQTIMTKAHQILAMGPDFKLMGPKATMLPSTKPVIAVVAVRTGCGKSPVSRQVTAHLKSRGVRTVAIRHPMPYGDLEKQGVQRFATLDDLVKHACTIEEMEEYEPHIENGTIVMAGVDYGLILKAAEKEADVVLWDGGNNDLSFYKPDLTICVVDPLRPGHETAYYPGHTNFILADVIVINKVDAACLENVQALHAAIQKWNPTATVVEMASPLTVEDPKMITGKRVLCVEDGPTLTHGEMKIGAGVVAAMKFGAAEIVDPRPYLVGELQKTFDKYPGIGCLLPAMGYGEGQVKDLETTINAVDCDVVLAATPVDIRRILKINKPALRVRYEAQSIGQPDLAGILDEFLSKAGVR
ncbi:MAG: cyclic 2,3-diphosphoglycerate synthase [Candidatus Eisenbacteria bacterium]|uniref:Cyclic 2,3-diphosphoglycerate synthase n=1 Tax=Eiseniibacteriota bacterium TaxID=2212470 RepID=A0A948RVR3_UNCEI|nr:cyclic 2,3-diphosphoglycerate synthase [Candidatus Eisenbacteria bacterium]MBU1948930.1 cyclic 2,3-diphosphoglycerate synthase [Candidatus Eisenbacteria bacterium]MBU2690584.1 cyclic 2,3-diphosphoglycerate synthase [Candidatus Eisenbacteria bacterium]